MIRRPEQGWWRKDEKCDISVPQVFAAPRNENVKGKIAIAHPGTWVPSNMCFFSGNFHCVVSFIVAIACLLHE